MVPEASLMVPGAFFMVPGPLSPFFLGGIGPFSIALYLGALSFCMCGPAKVAQQLWRLRKYREVLKM